MRRKKADTPPATPVAQQPGFKKVRRTEEFIEAVKDDSAQPQTITIPAEVIEDDEPVDRFEEFFSRVRDQQGWTLLVYRLNTFDKDGKTDLRGNNTYMGRITFDPDTYLDDIQSMCPEGGAFKLQAKTPDNRYSEQWMEKVAPIKSNKLASASNTHYIIQPQGNGQPAEPQRDTLKEFLASLKTVKEIKEVIGNGEPPPVQATPVQAVVEPPPLQDRIIEAALNAALKTEKPETVAGLLQSYLNPRSDEFSWKEIIGEVVKPMVPMFMGLLSAYMQNQARQQQAAVYQASVAQNTQQALPPPQTQPPSAYRIRNQQTGEENIMPVFMALPDGWTVVGPAEYAPQATPAFPASQDTFVMPTMEIPQNAPAPMSQIADTEDEDEMAENELLDGLVDMLQDCVNRAASDPTVIEAGRKEIADFRKRFPSMTRMIDMLASAPPVAVIGMLSFNYPAVAPLVNNAVAVQVIEDLQAALKRED